MIRTVSAGRSRNFGALGTPPLYCAIAVGLGGAVPRIEAYDLPGFPALFDGDTPPAARQVLVHRGGRDSAATRPPCSPTGGVTQ